MSEDLIVNPIELRVVLTVAAILFCLGIYGVLARRSAIGVLLCVEVMANAVNLAMLGFGRFSTGVAGQTLTLFAIALTVAEVVMGIAIVLLLRRTHGSVLTDAAEELRG
ncbi:MAG: NADH-quinone oxidoreductase subunit NuoK [Myxococcota bacterium]